MASWGQSQYEALAQDRCDFDPNSPRYGNYSCERLSALGVVFSCAKCPNHRQSHARAGWLHRGRHGAILFLTHSGKGETETYMIFLPHDQGGHESNCERWTAPRFPAFPIGDLNPHVGSLPLARIHLQRVCFRSVICRQELTS
jgi:hypothetical protein